MMDTIIYEVYEDSQTVKRYLYPELPTFEEYSFLGKDFKPVSNGELSNGDLISFLSEKAYELFLVLPSEYGYFWYWRKKT